MENLNFFCFRDGLNSSRANVVNNCRKIWTISRCDQCHLELKTRQQLRQHKQDAHQIPPLPQTRSEYFPYSEIVSMGAVSLPFSNIY